MNKQKGVSRLIPNKKVSKIPSKIRIGYEGEVNARSEDIDIAAELEEWPGTVPSILHKRKGDTEPHPVNTELHGKTLRWLFSAVDTAVDGWGVAQVVFTDPDGEVIGKSKTIQTETARSLEAPGDVPEVVQPWVDPLLAAAASVSTSAQDARKSAEDAAGSLQELRKGIESGDFKGEKGDPGRDGVDGLPGRDGYTPVKGVDYFDGAPGAPGKDGKDGKDGAEYDDTDIRKDIAEIDTAVSELKEDKAKQLNKPESGIAVGKYFRVAAVDELGNPVLQAVDLPVADTNTYGMIKARSDWDGFGIMKNGDGQLYVSRIDPVNNGFKNKTNRYNPITSDVIDDAVRIGLISNSKITEADKPLICETIGAELKKEWVLKGTIVGDETNRGNIDSGASVNMEGCTQVLIEGWCTSDANVLLSISPPHSGIVNGVGINGTRFSKTLIIEAGNGMSTLYAKSSDNKSPSYVYGSLTTYDYTNIKPSNIVRFLFESSYASHIKACDYKIYGR